MENEQQPREEPTDEKGLSAPSEEEQLKAALEEAKGELNDLKDRFMRAHAEMDNLRKRHDRERQDLYRYGNERLLGELLPVLDSFEKASQEQPSDADLQTFQQGITLVKKQLFDVLEKHGLKAIEAQGQKFDPNMHQAIQRIESADVTEDTVHQEFVKGYLLHDRLLRPAMVSVQTPNAEKKD
jgi:molecular chaperone GrpE